MPELVVEYPPPLEEEPLEELLEGMIGAGVKEAIRRKYLVDCCSCQLEVGLGASVAVRGHEAI